MITDEQVERMMAAFGKAMTQVEPDAAEALLRDAFGIDPEVYEWDQGEILKAIFKKVGSLDEGGLNRLLAKMAVAGGKEACKVASALFISQAADAEEEEVFFQREVAWQEGADKELERLREFGPSQRIPHDTPDGGMGVHVVPHEPSDTE